MHFSYENPDLERALSQARSLDELESALRSLGGLWPSSFLAPEAVGRQMLSPRLDALVPSVASALNLKDIQLGKSNENICIIATELYDTGGHSRVVSDITKIIGREKTILILTDIYGARGYAQPINLRSDPRFEVRSVMALSANSLAERIIELYMLLAAIRPSRIFLVAHHMDMVATAAAWPFRSIVEYLHHADHQPTLGATLPFSVHADLTYTCHGVCREAGVDPTYVGMTVPKTSHRTPSKRKEHPRIATCGRADKYQHQARYRWADFVISALRDNQAEFVHIGPWDEAFAADVHDPMAQAGLDPQRYRFLGPNPDLGGTLVAEDIDAYISSYPLSGGRANLEVIAAGLVPIVPISPDLPRLLQFNLPLPYWLPITTPEQLPAALAQSMELGEKLTSPQGQSAITAEFERFERYVNLTGGIAKNRSEYD